jgi:hypothetical protein
MALLASPEMHVNSIAWRADDSNGASFADVAHDLPQRM